MLTPLQTAAVRRIALTCLAAAATAVAALAIAATEARGATRGPLVVRIAETGPSRGIDGFRAFFNRDMNPSTARKLSNYALEGVAADGSTTRVALRSVRYDRRARIATVATSQAFSQGVYKQLVFRLKGRRGGLADVKGNLLDGNRDGRAGGDAVLRFDIVSGTSVTLRDQDGDEGRIDVLDGGSADAIVPVAGPATQPIQSWILDPIALRTRLGGAVTQSTTGDGLVVIAEISGLRGVNTAELSVVDGFTVNTLTFASAAVGR